jgi:hypothetical protein
MSRERERARPHHRATRAITVQVVALLRRPHRREVGDDCLMMRADVEFLRLFGRRSSPIRARVDPSTLALRLIARLGRPFNVLLLEQQANGQYKRVAAEHEIIVPGVPYKTDPTNIKSKALEIV